MFGKRKSKAPKVDQDKHDDGLSAESTSSEFDKRMVLDHQVFLELSASLSKHLGQDCSTIKDLADYTELVSISETRYREFIEKLYAEALSVSDTDPERSSSLLLTANYMEEVEHALLEGQQSKGGEAASPKKPLARRGLIAAMVTLGGVGALTSMSSPAMAVTGGAQNTPYLIKLLAEAKKAYDAAIEQLQGIMDTVNAVNSLNEVFVNGIDGLLNFQAEESTKQVTATATAADKQVQYQSDMRKIDSKLANQPNSGVCVDDTTTVINKDGQKKKAEAGAGAGKHVTSAEVTTVESDDSSAKGAEAAKDIETNNIDSLYGSGLIETPVPDTEIDRSNADKVYERMTAPPTELVRGKLLNYARTTAGKEAVRAIVTNKVRRSHAAGVLARYDQQRRTDPVYYTHLIKNLKASAESSGEPVDLGDTDDDGNPTLVVNHRHVAYAKRLVEDAEAMGVAGEDGKGISYSQALDFQVDAKNNSQFHEFIRSSGPSQTPLLRELVSLLSLSLEMQNEQRKSLAEISQLMAISNMIQLDSPVEVARLNKLTRKSGS